MTQDQVTAVAAVAVMISRELDDDYVEVWKLAWHLRRKLGDASDNCIQELAEAILRGLVESGVSIGKLSGETGTFIPWQEGDGIGQAMREWAKLGRDPNMGDIGWLARQS
jgi:hypothetical protein